MTKIGKHCYKVSSDDKSDAIFRNSISTCNKISDQYIPYDTEGLINELLVFGDSVKTKI